MKFEIETDWRSRRHVRMVLGYCIDRGHDIDWSEKWRLLKSVFTVEGNWKDAHLARRVLEEALPKLR